MGKYWISMPATIIGTMLWVMIIKSKLKYRQFLFVIFPYYDVDYSHTITTVIITILLYTTFKHLF